MECQREPRPRRVRLTDQGLVAVTVARRAAEALGREATSGDLLLGIAAEPDGWAGHLLRRREGAIVALAGRADSLPPGLAPLEAVVAAAADAASPRPPGTRDLLLAVLAVGGPDVTALLGGCGLDVADLRAADGGERLDHRDWEGAAEVLWAASRETVTLAGPGAPVLGPEAALAVGRVRAVAGGAVDLVLVLAASHPDALPGEIGAIGARAISAARDALAPVRDAPPSWDAGLDPVLAGVRLLAPDRAARPADLLQAALLAGGSGPLAVLEHARLPRDARQGSSEPEEPTP